MTYRDDREALKGRIAELRDQSDALEKELAQTATAREEYADLKEAFNRAQTELDRVKNPAPVRPTRGLGLGFFAFMAILFVIMSFNRGSHPSRKAVPEVQKTASLAANGRKDAPEQAIQAVIVESDTPMLPRDAPCTFAFKGNPEAGLVSVRLSCDGMQIYEKREHDAGFASVGWWAGIPSFADEAERGAQRTIMNFEGATSSGRVESRSKGFSISFVLKL
jgi:hypothetical protein